MHLRMLFATPPLLLVTNILFVYPLKYCLLQHEVPKCLPYKYILQIKTSYILSYLISRFANSPHLMVRFRCFGSVLAISPRGKIITLLLPNFQLLSIGFVFCDSQLLQKIPLKYVCFNSHL